MLLKYVLRDIFRAKKTDTGEGTSGGAADGAAPEKELTALDRMRPPRNDSSQPSADSEDDTGEITEETADKTAATQDDVEDEDTSEDDETFSDEVLERAIELGLTSREISRRFETEAELERECDRRERMERIEQKVRAKDKDEKKVHEEKSPKGEALDKKLAELLAGGIDSETVAFLKELKEFAAAGHEEAKQARKMLAELKEASDEMKQRVEQAEITRILENKERQFDSVIETLDEEYPGAFGKGRGERLDQRSKEYKNRAAVWKRYVAIERSYIEDGQRPPGPQQLVKEAAAAVFAGRTTEVARNRLKEDIKKAGSQTLVRSRSNHKELTGEALARQQEREFWEKNKD